MPRVKQGDDAKLPLSSRVSPEFMVLLQAAAKQAGRSVSQEVEHRLLASFAAQTPSLTAEDVRQIVREEMGRPKPVVPTIVRCGTCDREQFHHLCTRVECPQHWPTGGFDPSRAL